MPQLAMLVLLFVVPMESERLLPDGLALAAQSLAIDPCDLARQIAARGPCLEPDDCEAFDEWKKVLGLPGMRPLTPETARGRIVLRRVPPTAVCPAGEASTGLVPRMSVRHVRRNESRSW